MTRARAVRAAGGAAGRSAIAILLALAFLLAGARPAAAAPSTGSASSLLQIEQVGTRVDAVAASLADAGVTRDLLRQRLGSLLRDAQVPAAEAAEGALDHALSVQTTYIVNSGWHVVSLSLYYTRAAALAADPTTTITATVWSRATIVVARKKNLVKEVETALSDLVTGFAEDYRAANRR